MTIDTRPFRHLYPFDARFAEINGFRMHYLDEGDGPPVVMLHGNPTWSFYYRNLVKELSPDCRTIVPDHIGCGLSEKPGADRYDYRLQSRVDDLETLLEHLDIRKEITLIVHDWGGMIGTAFAVRHPDRIRRLVITNTAAFPKPVGKPLPMRLRMIRRCLPFAVPAVLGLNIFAAAALYMAPRKPLPAAVKKGLTAPYNSWHNRIATLKFVQDIPLFKNDPSYALVEKTARGLHHLAHIPMLVLWGRHDFVFDMTYFDMWRRLFPNAEFHVFDTAGHYLFEDEPAATLHLIRRFLSREPQPA